MGGGGYHTIQSAALCAVQAESPSSFPFLSTTVPTTTLWTHLSVLCSLFVKKSHVVPWYHTGMARWLDASPMCASCHFYRPPDQRPARSRVPQAPMLAACILLLALPCLVHGLLESAQRAALLDLFNATNGPGWISSTSWGTGYPCNTSTLWSGVFCDASGTSVR